MTTPSAGAMRAAKLWLGTSAKPGKAEQLASIIDRETNHAALVEAAKMARPIVADRAAGGRMLVPVSAAGDALAVLDAALSKEGA